MTNWQRRPRNLEGLKLTIVRGEYEVQRLRGLMATELNKPVHNPAQMAKIQQAINEWMGKINKWAEMKAELVAKKLATTNPATHQRKLDAQRAKKARRAQRQDRSQDRSQ